MSTTDAALQRTIGQHLATAFFSGLLSIPAVWTIIGSVYGMAREAYCRTREASEIGVGIANSLCIYFHNDFRPDLVVIVIAFGFLYLGLHTVTLRNSTPARQLIRVLILYLFAFAVWVPFRLLPSYTGSFESW